jgi:glycosyltransferase involved in cell wall biosynthesis
VWDLLTLQPPGARPLIRAPLVGDAYEFGTQAYRAGVYAGAVEQGVPPGVPVIVSDDPAAWRAAAWTAGRNPFIGVVHGELAEYDELVRRYAPYVSAFVGVSHRVTQRVRSVLGHDRIPTVTIPCGIRLPDMPRRAHTRGDPIRLVWVGRMREEAKRVSDLPKIAACLRERRAPFSMDIMGDGEERPSLAEEISRRGLGELVRLHLWGTPTAVESLLGGADVLLLPSNREGMPITVMEALSLGCAIVASRVSGVEDYENHALANGCFWVHDIGNVEAAASAIERAAETNPDSRAARARALAEAEFSVERTVEHYQRLIHELRPPQSLLPSVLDRHPTLRRLVSMPVAAQRIARLWSSGRYRRPERASAQ